MSATYFCDSPMKVLGQVLLDGIIVLENHFSRDRVAAQSSRQGNRTGNDEMVSLGGIVV